MTIKGDGNVGIGTTQPGEKLDIVGNLRVIGAIYGIGEAGTSGSGDIIFLGDDTKLTDIGIANTVGLYGQQDTNQGHLKLGSSGPTLSGVDGNVGIGTTSPNGKMDIIDPSNTADDVDDGAGGHLRLSLGSAVTDESLFFGVNSDGYSWIQPIDPGNAYRDLVLNPKGGNVGIGTTNPTQRLQIIGNILVKGTNSFINVNDEAVVNLGDTNHYIKAVNGVGLRLGTFLAEDALVVQQSTGNVGIGTDNPRAKLDVIGGIRAQKGAPANDSGNVGYAFETDGDTGMFAEGGDEFTGSDIVFRSDSFAKLRITADGRVGIGKANPFGQLHVVGKGRGAGAAAIFESGSNEAAQINVETNDSGTRAEMGAFGDGRGVFFGSNSADDVSFRVGAGTKMIINKAGNVGIGTTNPTERLHVNGKVRATDFVTSSSRDYKKNIQDLSAAQAEAALSQMNPVQYQYKSDDLGDQHVGFIAEDVPDLVATPGRKGVSALDMVAVLTKVLQEQQRKIAELEARLQAVEVAK